MFSIRNKNTNFNVFKMLHLTYSFPDENLESNKIVKRLYSKQLFLIYNGINLKKEDVINQLSAIFERKFSSAFEKKIKEFLLSEEKDEIGNSRICIYLKSNDKMNFSAANELDLYEQEGTKIKWVHGVYEAVKNKAKKIEQIKKNASHFSFIQK
jgi:hypothetical protein